jgi:hypothetical protein
MANSFAEAFKLAQARQAKATVVKHPDPPATMVAAVPTEPDIALWADETASVIPLQSATAIETTAVEVANVLCHPPPLASDMPATAIIVPRHPKKKAKTRNPNLEAYYERMALAKASLARNNSSQPRYPHLCQPRDPKLAPKGEPNGVILTVAPEAKVVWDGRSASSAPLLAKDSALGIRSQLSNDSTNVREVVLGFDFGTSSSKVVIGDRDLKKAHAVPFRDAIGIDAYLLPARLYEDNGAYNLRAGTRKFDDLKLALLAKPDDINLQCHVVAYLALAIREARAWMFMARADDYAKVHILWTMALGLPAAYVIDTTLTELFSRIGAAGWAVAGGEAVVSSDTCLAALAAVVPEQQNDDLVVTVTPEIAAQVYGFISSRSFDEKARNFFLIADVGAGTVDTCLFRVARAKGGRWSFEVCTSAVEAAGVMNLHRHRVAWWQQQLSASVSNANLCEQLQQIRFATEYQTTIPASYDGYLSGVKAQFSGNKLDPDSEFFKTPLLRQVQGGTLYRAVQDRRLGKQDIIDIPFFLCGGGARMAFYQRLKDALRTVDGCSWLRTRSHFLTIPSNLRADGLAQADYDRLSVAYGLSMLDSAGLSAMPQLEKLPGQSPNNQWHNYYIDKDLC